MFRPDLYHSNDEALIKARDAATNVLSNAVRRSLGPNADEQEVLAGVIASWSFAHGFANLWAAGNTQAIVDSDPEELARLAANAFVQLVLAGAQRGATIEPAPPRTSAFAHGQDDPPGRRETSKARKPGEPPNRQPVRSPAL
jgi:isochorismate synthase EntC